MIEGTFDVAVDTPKHHKRGTLALKSEGSAIVARLELAGLDPLDFEGTCEDKAFTFEGSADLPGLGSTGYRATGEVWGNSVDVKCETGAGRVTVFGTRLASSAGDLRSSHEYLMKASTGNFDADDSTMYSGRYADGG